MSIDCESKSSCSSGRSARFSLSRSLWEVEKGGGFDETTPLPGPLPKGEGDSGSLHFATDNILSISFGSSGNNPDLGRRGVSTAQFLSIANTLRNSGSESSTRPMLNEGDGVPVDHFGVIGNEFFRRAVFAQRAFVVFVLDREIACIHVIVRALQSHQPS